MKRILAILILIFITSLYTATVFSTIEKKPKMSEVIKKNQKKSIQPKKTVVKKTITTETFKPVKTLGPNLSPVEIKKGADSTIHHNATWYKTDGTRVHREYPTAAYNHVPKGTKLLVTNTKTQKTCVVEVTDRNGMGKYHIDLSHSAFGSLANHSIGTIKVFVKIL